MTATYFNKFIKKCLFVLVFASCGSDDNSSGTSSNLEEPAPGETAIIERLDVTVNQWTNEFLGEVLDAGLDIDDPADAIAIEEIRRSFRLGFEEPNSGGSRFLEGYVVSSDESGNFFEELIIQDTPENPTAGIRVLIDVSALHTFYEFGRKVLVRLDGLSLGIENGVLTLGGLDGARIRQIPASQQDEIIEVSEELATITPLEITFDDFSNSLLNMFVKISNVQFTSEAVLTDDLTFAGEPTDDIKGERVLESCSSGRSAILSTNTLADFNRLKLPPQRGSFEGILSKNFSGDTFNLILNDPTGLVFEIDERCDDGIECLGSSGDTTVIFEEGFSVTNFSSLIAEGWVNVNVGGGIELFEIASLAGNRYPKISAFRTEENPLEVWLVTPEIDLDGSTNEAFSCDIEAAFDDGLFLEIFITDNFTGDGTTTEWKPLKAAIPRAPGGGFGGFEPVGPINISCFNGGVRIAFRYLGGDPEATTRYHIDNVIVTGD